MVTCSELVITVMDWCF